MGFTYSQRIHPHDEMFTWLLRKGRTRTQAFSEYMVSGYTIYRNIGDVLAGTGRRITGLTSLLDFASGYGRLTRFLIGDIAPQNITISDINPEAVRFQTEQFGVNGFFSSEDPRALAIEKRFDIIICISLFSHLPEESFVQWLDTLLGLCVKEGMLIFTTHPLENVPVGPRTRAGSGGACFRYVNRSESGLLHPSRYGTSYVSYSFVERILRDHDGRKIIAYLPRGLNNHQDIYLIGNSAEEERDVMIRVLPYGCIDMVTVSGDKTLVSGWAYDSEFRSAVREVTIFGNGRRMGQAQVGLRREDVAQHLDDPAALHTGFSCVCHCLFDSADMVCAAIRGEKTSSLLFYRAYRAHPLCERLMPAINVMGNLLKKFAGRGRQP